MWLAVWVALLALWALPLPALAHQALRSSTPAPDDTLTVAPRELRLVFANPVDLSLATLSLAGPAGGVALAPLHLEATTPNMLVGEITGSLVAGTYTVVWRVVGVDGHPVRGEYRFTIASGAEGLAPPVLATPSVPVPPPSTPTVAFDAESPLYAAVRWLLYLGLLGAIGSVAFRLLVIPGAQRRARSAEFLRTASHRAARLGLAFAALLTAAVLLRLLAQGYALRGGVPDAPIFRTLLLTGTAWGWGWWLQAGGTAAALLGLGLAMRDRRGGWALAALGVLTVAVAEGLSGHAASASGNPGLAVTADALHVLGAGGWLGSLLFMLLAGIPATRRLAPGERGAAVAALVGAFSPVALLFAGIVVATGVLGAWLHLDALPELWRSGYGRTLLLKLAVLTGVFGTGAYNWLRVRPALGNETGTRRLRRSATLELAVGAVVLAVTAVLVATATPGIAEQGTTAAAVGSTR